MFGLNGSTVLLGAGAIAASFLLWLLLRSTKSQAATEATAAVVHGLDAETIKATQEAAKEVTREVSADDVEAAMRNKTF